MGAGNAGLGTSWSCWGWGSCCSRQCGAWLLEEATGGVGGVCIKQLWSQHMCSLSARLLGPGRDALLQPGPFSYCWAGYCWRPRRKTPRLDQMSPHRSSRHQLLGCRQATGDRIRKVRDIWTSTRSINFISIHHIDSVSAITMDRKKKTHLGRKTKLLTWK